MAAAAIAAALSIGAYQVSETQQQQKPQSESTLSRLSPCAVAVPAACWQWSVALSEETPVPASSAGMNPKDFTAMKLKRVQPYNHNTALYTFALPDASSSLELPVSSCIMLRCKGPDGKDVVRPYTPVDTHRKGELVLLIKAYPTGAMSQHLVQMRPGDSIDVKGPMPKLKYSANMKKNIGMIAGGTGITPMLQVLEEIAANPADKTRVHLVFANVSGRDVLMRETLDALVKRNPNVSVTYVIDSAQQDKDWSGEVGRINKELIKKVVPFSPKDKDNVLIYVCGPPEMMKAISGDKAKDYSQGELAGALKELGFSKDQVYKF